MSVCPSIHDLVTHIETVTPADLRELPKMAAYVGQDKSTEFRDIWVPYFLSLDF
jgi:hypothetical protein